MVTTLILAEPNSQKMMRQKVRVPVASCFGVFSNVRLLYDTNRKTEKEAGNDELEENPDELANSLGILTNTFNPFPEGEVNNE